MCLVNPYYPGLSKEPSKYRTDSHLPWVETDIRWKVAYLDENGELLSPFKTARYRRGEWTEAAGKHDFPDQWGYHVCIDRDDAEMLRRARDYGGSVLVLLKVQVRGLIESGFNQLGYGEPVDGSPGERWAEMKILEVIR